MEDKKREIDWDWSPVLSLIQMHAVLKALHNCIPPTGEGKTIEIKMDVVPEEIEAARKKINQILTDALMDSDYEIGEQASL